MENTIHTNIILSESMQKSDISTEVRRKKTNKKGKKKKKWYFIPLIILYVLLAIVASLVITLFILNILFQGVYVSGASMEPTLEDGDFLYMRRRVLPNRDDIIVIQARDEKGNNLFVIKRVIGLAGDKIYQENGQLVRQQMGKEKQYCGSIGENHRDFPTVTRAVTVEANSVFVCGDNRTNSLDSRTDWFGRLSLDGLEGVITPWSIQVKAQLKVIYKFFNTNQFVGNSMNKKEYIYGERGDCSTI